MKQALVVTVITLMLTGCTMDKLPSHSTQQSQTPPMAKEELSVRPLLLEGTEEGWALNSSGAYNSAVYEIKVKGTSEVGLVHAWLDHYVKGKPAESEDRLEVGSMTFNRSERPIKFYFHTFTLDDDKQMWVFSLRGEGNNNSNSQTTIRQNVTPLYHTSSMFTKIEPQNVGFGHSVDLALLVFSGTGNGTSIGEVSETIRTNDEVYVLRCQFNR